MKVGIIQQANSSDINSNIIKLQDKIRSLANEGAELIVMQELHNGLYFCQTEDPDVFDQAETIPGPSTKPKVSIESIEPFILYLFVECS